MHVSCRDMCRDSAHLGSCTSKFNSLQRVQHTSNLKAWEGSSVLKHAVGHETRQVLPTFSSHHRHRLSVWPLSCLICLCASSCYISPSDIRGVSVASYSSRSIGCGTYALFSVWRTGSTFCGTFLPRSTIVRRSRKLCRGLICHYSFSNFSFVVLFPTFADVLLKHYVCLNYAVKYAPTP